MSAMDQARRFGDQPATSALPRSTDIIGPARLVRFVPTTEVAALFNHPVGERDQPPIGIAKKPERLSFRKPCFAHTFDK
jgi:hypothetical protein